MGYVNSISYKNQNSYFIEDLMDLYTGALFIRITIKRSRNPTKPVFNYVNIFLNPIKVGESRIGSTPLKCL